MELFSHIDVDFSGSISVEERCPAVRQPCLEPDFQPQRYSNKNKGISTRSKKLLVAPGITTSNKDATSKKGISTRSQKGLFSDLRKRFHP